MQLFVITAIGRTYAILPQKIIRDAVRAVAALPPAHVIVERLFSALKIIKFDLTVSVKEEIADATLFLETYN